MKLRSAVSMLALVGAASCSHFETAEPAPYAWLTGCWVSDDGGSREVWSRAEGGVLFGYALTLGRDGTPAFFEQLRIETNGERDVYVAYPNGGSPTTFTAVMTGEGRALFANPEHDFPQVVDYARDGFDLVATVAAIDGGDPEVFRKSRCGFGG